MTDEVRLSVSYPELPSVADRAPHRVVLVGDAAGRCEIFAWDRREGTTRQVTARASGTALAAVDPTGTWVWWFDDDRSARGVWRCEPFDTGPGPRARPETLPPGYARGLAFARDGAAVVGLGDGADLTVYRCRADGAAPTAFQVPGYAYLVDTDPDGRLDAVGADEASPDAVRVFAADGALVERLPVPAGGRLWALGFAPRGATRLLLVVEDGDGYAVACWEPGGAPRRLPGCRFGSEITASWFPDGRRVLIRHSAAARSVLHVADPPTRSLTGLATPAGTLLDAAAWPDGDVAHVWTDTLNPARVSSAHGIRLPAPATGGPPPDRPPWAELDERWVPGPGGAVHTLLAAPVGAGDRPLPTVVLVHGGPYQQATDAYDPWVEVLVRSGYRVVRANYRGSAGYGPAWRNDFSAGVGLTQIADLAAVRADLVAHGAADPAAVALCGTSWGGYLTLLALGVQPELWRLGVALDPVADYPAAFAATTPAVRALDVRLFGGTPDEVADRYARSSPLSYVDQVVAPVYLSTGTHDVRCPPGQVLAYARALHGRGVPCRFVRTDAGHVDLDGGAHLRQLGEVLDFLGEHLAGATSTARERR